MKIFRKITMNVCVEHATVDDPDYDRYIIETEVLTERKHTYGEQYWLNEGYEEISQQDWDDYCDDLMNIPGSRPPTIPRP